MAAKRRAPLTDREIAVRRRIIGKVIRGEPIKDVERRVIHRAEANSSKSIQCSKRVVC